jgi:O-antigen ligase
MSTPVVADKPSLGWISQYSPLIGKILIFIFFELVLIGLGPPALIGSKDVDASLIQSAEGNPLKQLLYVVLFGCSLALPLFATPRSINVKMPLTFVVMIAWCLLSLAWASAPDVAIRRVILLIIVAAFAFNIVRVVGWSNAIDFVAQTLAVVIGLDCFAMLALPGAYQLGDAVGFVSDPSGTWRGLHLDKNMAGVIAALGALFFIFKITTPISPRQKFLWAFFTLLALVFVFKSGSKTSLVLIPAAGLIALGLTGLARDLRLATLALCVLGGAIALTLLLTPNLPDQVAVWFTAMMKDPRSLTGRVQIWQVLLQYAGDHFWKGSGYGSFWSVGDDGPMTHYASGWLLTVPNAHNGYLDLEIQTGFVGLVIAVLAAILIPLVLAVVRRGIPDNVRWLIAVTILFCAMHNFLEASLFDRDKAAWAVLLFVIAILSAFRKQGDPAPTPSRV